MQDSLTGSKWGNKDSVGLNDLSGKESKSVFDFLTYLRETWFSFSYRKVQAFDRLIGLSNEIDRVSKFDNAKQKSLGQIFFAL